MSKPIDDERQPPRRSDEDEPAASPSGDVRLVVRACKICEWQGEIVERGDEAPGCPWCHGPTDLVRVVTPGDVARGEKNPHAAALGRLGGLKGGHARAAALSPKERRAIALKAAKARWRKSKPPKS